MRVGDLVRVDSIVVVTDAKFPYPRKIKQFTVNVITKIEKRRNDHGTHDKFAYVLGCGKQRFYEKDVEVLSEGR
jgi:hypothetical protein